MLGGACFVILEQLEYVSPTWFGMIEPMPFGGGTFLLSHSGEYAAYLLFVLPLGFKIALLTMVLPMLILRKLLRLPALAAIVYVAYHAVAFSNGTILGYLLYGLSFSLLVFVLTRFGLLALAIFWIHTKCTCWHSPDTEFFRVVFQRRTLRFSAHVFGGRIRFSLCHALPSACFLIRYPPRIHDASRP